MNRKLLFLGIFIIILVHSVYSLATYKDYGITSDEESRYKSGKILLEYYKTGSVPENINLAERHLPQNSIYFSGHLALSNLLNPNFYYEQFHLINLFYSLPIFIAIFYFLYKEYGNFLLSFLGPIFIFLTPRFFGHIPANPKDVPFAVTYFISLLGIYFLNTQSKSNLIDSVILGVLFGISQSFRSIGFTLHIILFFYSLVSLVYTKITKKIVIKKLSKSFLVLIVSLAVMIAIMPLLQNNILEGFKEIFVNSQSFTYWDNKILYFGKFLSKKERPVSYLPIWISITTPLFIIIPFLLSPMVYFFCKSKRKIFLLLGIAILINFLGYLIIKPVIYNGLRHFLYLIPIIVLISLISIIEIFQIVNKKSKIFSVLLVVLITSLAGFTFRDKLKLYPYEYIYFNEMVGGLPKALGMFDTEYWGASYKESAIWVRDNLNVQEKIKVYPCNVSFAVDYYSHKKFDIVGTKSEADYIICDYDNALIQESPFEIIYTVSRMGGVPLNYVGKLEK